MHGNDSDASLGIQKDTLFAVYDGSWFGIDSDTKSELRHLTTFINALRIAKTTVASTEDGYHYRVFLKCPMETALELRRLLRDDAQRIGAEEKERQDGITDWGDTLFQMKMEEGGKWHYEEPVENSFALPFWSTARARKLPVNVRKRYGRKRKHHSKGWRIKYERRKGKHHSQR